MLVCIIVPAVVIGGGGSGLPVMLTVTSQPQGELPQAGTDAAVNWDRQQSPAVQQGELRAVWVAYTNYGATGVGPEAIDNIIATCKNNGINAIMFQVRPFGDALYDSEYFPWSHFVTGTQGTAPGDGYDPLAYIIDKAHESGIELHAWVNPLRIQSSGGTLPPTLSQDNPYFIYRSDADASNDCYVVDYQGGKYYNPGEPAVRELIINGMTEIAARYNVDGLHWDDYFYPAADQSFDDSVSYAGYIASGGKLSLLEWRQQNISLLIRDSYKAIKAVNSGCEFGISPAGNIQNCLNAGADVYTWCSSEGYIDYICPQIYWSFENEVAPFAQRCAEWRLMVRGDVKFYVGLALYKAGSSADSGLWQRADNIIATQIQYIRGDTIGADGFMLYSYDYLTSPQTSAEMANVMSIINQ